MATNAAVNTRVMLGARSRPHSVVGLRATSGGGRDGGGDVIRPSITRALDARNKSETVARLEHPHILPLYDSGRADGFLFYVMPYVEGESLRDRLERKKQLSLEDALKITAEV